MEIRPPDIAPDAPLPEPQEKSALGFFITIFALYALLGSAAQAAHPVAGLAWTELFVFLVPALAAAAGSNLSPRFFLLLGRRPRPLQLLVATCVGGALFLAASGVMTLTTLVVPRGWTRLFDLSHLFFGSGTKPLLMALIASVLAPLSEEIAFRGYAQSALRTWARPWPSILGGAFLFAGMHLDPVRFPAVLLLGIAFGWLAFRSGSIWPSVAAHAVNNFLGSAVALSSGADPSADADLLAALATLAAGLAALAPLALLYRRATPTPSTAGDAMVLLDPRDPSLRFRWRRIPKPLRWFAVAGLLVFLCLVAYPGKRSRSDAEPDGPASRAARPVQGRTAKPEPRGRELSTAPSRLGPLRPRSFSTPEVRRTAGRQGTSGIAPRETAATPGDRGVGGSPRPTTDPLAPSRPLP